MLRDASVGLIFYSLHCVSPDYVGQLADNDIIRFVWRLNYKTYSYSRIPSLSLFSQLCLLVKPKKHTRVHRHSIVI